jgi:hypothetical protein
MGATAALLSMLWIIVSRAYHISSYLNEKVNLPLWFSEGISFIGAPLVVALYLLWQLQVARNVRRIKLLAINPSFSRNNYFKIGPYSSGELDQKQFNRSDSIQKEIIDWLLNSNENTLYLSGDSGVGKSSLLSAFVKPKITYLRWNVLECRALHDPLLQIRKSGEIQGRLGPTDVTVGLAELANKVRTRGRNLLLIIDQFEEFLISGEKEKIDEFCTFLCDFEKATAKGIKIIISIRNDYLARRTEAGFTPLREKANWLQVSRFTFAAAARFLDQSGLGLLPEARDQLISSAALMDGSPGIVRPITLNVIGHVLAEGPTKASSLDAGTLVRSYITQTVDSDATREISRPVLEKLVTDQGTKQPVTENDLVEKTHLGRGEVRAVLNCLGAAALAKSLDANQGVWELSHDFIARAVAQYLGRHRSNFRRNALIFAAPTLFGVMFAASSATLLYARQNLTSGSDVRIIPDPEIQTEAPIAGYPGKYASFDYKITVHGEDVQFQSLDSEYRHLDGTVISRTAGGRFLGGSFKVRAGETHDFTDKLAPAAACEKITDNDQGQVYFDYTFNGVDMHNIRVMVHAIVRIVC